LASEGTAPWNYLVRLRVLHSLHNHSLSCFMRYDTVDAQGILLIVCAYRLPATVKLAISLLRNFLRGNVVTILATLFCVIICIIYVNNPDLACECDGLSSVARCDSEL